MKIYGIALTNSSQDQEKYLVNNLGQGWLIVHRQSNGQSLKLISLYWPFWFCLLFALLPLVLLVIHFFIAKAIKPLFSSCGKYVVYIARFSRFIFYPIYLLTNRLRYMILLAFLIVIGFDMIYNYKVNSYLFTASVILWIFILIGFRLPAKINYYAAILLFLFYAVLFQTFRVDKISLWIFILVFLGLFHSTIYQNSDNANVLQNDISRIKLFGKTVAITKFIIYWLNVIGDAIGFYIVRFYGFIKEVIILIIRKAIKFKPKNKKEVAMNIFRALVLILIALLVLFSIFLVTLYGYRSYLVYLKKMSDLDFKKTREYLNPVIEKIQPNIVYPGSKIVLYGKGFNSRSIDENITTSTLRNKENEQDSNIIITDYWDDGKIIFTVPLHWKTGINHLWIDKMIIWDNKTEVAKSNIVSFKLIPVTGEFTPDDDAFFDQLKNLTPEVRKINGYE